MQLCGTRVKPQSWTWAGLPVTQREPGQAALRSSRTDALISNCLLGIASFLGKVLKSKRKELCWDGGDFQPGRRAAWKDANVGLFDIGCWMLGFTGQNAGRNHYNWHGIGGDQQGSLNHKGLSPFSSLISIWCCKEEGSGRRLTWSKQRIRQVIRGVEHCLDVKIHFSKAKEKKDDCSNWEESQAVLRYLKE